MGTGLAVLDGDGVARYAVLAVGTARSLHGVGDEHQPLTRQTVGELDHVGSDVEAVADHLAKGGIRGQPRGHHTAVAVMEGGHGVEGMGQGGDTLGKQLRGGLKIGVGVTQRQGRPQLQSAAEEVTVIQLQSGGNVTGTLHAAEQSLHLGGVGLHQKVGGMGTAALDVEVTALQMGSRDVRELALGGGTLGAESIDAVDGGLQLGERGGGQGGHDGGDTAVQIGLGHDRHEGGVGGAEVPSRTAVGVDVHQTGDDTAAFSIVYGNPRGRGDVLGEQSGNAAVLHQNRPDREDAGHGTVDPRVADEAGIHTRLLSGIGPTTAFCILFIITDRPIFFNRFS